MGSGEESKTGEKKVYREVPDSKLKDPRSYNKEKEPKEQLAKEESKK